MTRTSVRTRDPERKNRILAAAAELIGRNGFHGVSMTDIGNEAGITGSGIYRHFDGKAAILVDLFDQIIDDLMAQQAEILGHAEPAAAALQSLIDGQVGFVVGKRELARVYHNEIQSLPHEDRVRLRRKQRLYLEEWVHLLREARPDLDDAEARTLVHAAIGAIQSVLFHKVGLDLERQRAHLTSAASAVMNISVRDGKDMTPSP
jgi:AcrR family transcriptional regulator